jgi:predicted nucleic acid-binding protein
MRRPLTPAETAIWVDRLFQLPLVEVDRQIVENALIVQQRYRLSYWDSQIVAAAERSGAETLRSGAETLYSEDSGHGQMYGRVRCENPFQSN